MIGKCALTQNECQLRQSHIYPKFVIEWARKTGSNFLRPHTTPNRRMQDGYKIPLLSDEAEQMFSIREKWFAENVFHPYLKDSTITFLYNENLFYFAISMLWRILVMELRQPHINQFRYIKLMGEAEKQWRSFLYTGIYPKDFDHIHLMLTDRVASHTFQLKGVDYYFTRTFDGTTVFNENGRCAIYVKFSRFIFWGFLTEVDDNHFIGTKIDPIRGSMKMYGQQMSNFVYDFYQNRMRQIEDAMQYASENQQEVILQEIKKNKEKFTSSELGDILRNDNDVFEKNKS